MFIGVNLELSSLVLQNKSHPSFLVGGCTGPFLQFKCTSYMVRTIKHMHNDKLFYPILHSSMSHGKFLDFFHLYHDIIEIVH